MSQFQIPQSGKVEVVLQVINEVTSNMKATEGNSPGRRKHCEAWGTRRSVSRSRKINVLRSSRQRSRDRDEVDVGQRIRSIIEDLNLLDYVSVEDMESLQDREQ